MPGESDALKGAVSERALDELEVFTRHGGWNDEDITGWRRFIVYTFLDGKSAQREALRRHLRETRPEDSAERTEGLLDEYDDGIALLKTFERLRAND